MTDLDDEEQQGDDDGFDKKDNEQQDDYTSQSPEPIDKEDEYYERLKNILTSEQLSFIATNWPLEDLEYLVASNDNDERRFSAATLVKDVRPPIDRMPSLSLNSILNSCTTIKWLTTLHSNHQSQVVTDTVIQQKKHPPISPQDIMKNLTTSPQVIVEKAYDKVKEPNQETNCAMINQGQDGGEETKRDSGGVNSAIQGSQELIASTVKKILTGMNPEFLALMMMANASKGEMLKESYKETPGKIGASSKFATSLKVQGEESNICDDSDYGTYHRQEDDDDGLSRFSLPFDHDLIQGKFSYPIDTTKNDVTALWGVVYCDPEEKSKHYMHASTETKMTRVRNLMPKQASRKRNSTTKESINASLPKFLPAINHLTNCAPTEADDCPQFLTNYPGIPLRLPLGRSLPACAFVTETTRPTDNKKCRMHTACGKYLRPGDLCIVDGRDT